MPATAPSNEPDELGGSPGSSQSLLTNSQPHDQIHVLWQGSLEPLLPSDGSSVESLSLGRSEPLLLSDTLSLGRSEPSLGGSEVDVELEAEPEVDSEVESLGFDPLLLFEDEFQLNVGDPWDPESMLGLLCESLAGDPLESEFESLECELDESPDWLLSLFADSLLLKEELELMLSSLSDVESLCDEPLLFDEEPDEELSDDPDDEDPDDDLLLDEFELFEESDEEEALLELFDADDRDESVNDFELEPDDSPLLDSDDLLLGLDELL